MKKTLFLLMVFLLAVSLVPMIGQPGRTQARQQVEITFVHIFPDDRDVRRTLIEEIVAAYMAEHPDVSITIQSTSEDYADVFEGAVRAASQGAAPHLIQVEDSLTQIAIDSQYFAKMSDFATDEQLATVPDIIEPMRNFYGMTESEFWMLPWNASNPIMYYNPVVFEAAGLDPDTPPQTFDEIMAACDAIMAANVDKIEACINWPVNSWLPEQWVSMQNALFVNNENGRAERATESLLDSPEMLAVLTWWKEMADKGYFTYSGTPGDYYGEGLMFVTGKTAIVLSTSAGITNTITFGELMGKFTPRITYFPKPYAEATNGVTAGGAALWVMAGHPDDETQAAVDFAFYLTNTQNMSAWHKASGYYPVRQSSIDALLAEGWFDENPAFYVPLDQLLGHAPNPANAGMRIGAATQVRGAVIDAALSVIDGGEDPAAALAAAKQRADKAIDEYNSVIGG